MTFRGGEKKGCTVKVNTVQGNTEAMFYMLQVFLRGLFCLFKCFVHKTPQKAHRLRLSSILCDSESTQASVINSFLHPNICDGA